jgi:hypothetical protein
MIVTYSSLCGRVGLQVVELVNDIVGLGNEVVSQFLVVLLGGHAGFRVRDAADEVGSRFQGAVE